MKPEDSSRLSRLLLLLTAFCLSAVLVNMVFTQVEVYNQHKVGVTVNKKTDAQALRFPAISVCSSYFRFKKLTEDLGEPPHPFRPIKKALWNNPAIAYQKLDYNTERPMTVNQFLWSYYFTLDEMFAKTNVRSLKNKGCSVGGVSCEPAQEMGPWPEEEHELFRFEVPAGYWISRFLADSEFGNNVLCHTLVSNVSLDFARRGGNAITVKWDPEVPQSMPWWRLYVHDPAEQLVLPAYSMVDLPYLTFNKVEGDPMAAKKKARIRLEKHNRPGTYHHPCNSDPTYSQYACELRNNWESRLDTLRRHFGPRFDCLLPGLMFNRPESRAMPLCTKGNANDENDTVGYVDLMIADGDNNDFKQFEEQIPTLISPPIGVEGYYKTPSSSSRCPRRCTSLEYRLDSDQMSEDDEMLQWTDVALYFSSGELEEWTEFEEYSLVSLFSDIGGSMGLLLGLSILSLVELGHKAVRVTVGKLF